MIPVYFTGPEACHHIIEQLTELKEDPLVQEGKKMRNEISSRIISNTSVDVVWDESVKEDIKWREKCKPYIGKYFEFNSADYYLSRSPFRESFKKYMSCDSVCPI